MQRFASLLALAALGAAPAQTVLPTAASAAAGALSNGFPFGTNASFVPGLRISCVYDSSNFTGAPVPVTAPMLITGIEWRANDVSATTSWSGGAYTLGVKVTLATAAVDYLAATTNFAANLGPDARIVHNGPVTVVAGTGAGIGVPGPYVVNIPVMPPFVYDPNAGDLVVDTDYLGPGNFVGGTLPQMDVAAIASTTGRRVYSSSLYPVANGVDWACPVIRISHVPAIGLYPGFHATPRTGPLGQQVHFTDQTFTSDPGGITSWAWDVDGVPGTDYTTQHCSHTYTTEGAKDCVLTVTSSQFGVQSSTRIGHIVIDAVKASFTAAIGPGSTIAFYTDRSTGTPTSWAWDFENDGIVDTTLQNPLHTYPAGTTQMPCRLVVADAFSNDTTTVNIGFGIVPVPAFGSQSTSQATRGFWFRAPTRFSVVSARVPDGGSSVQNVAFFRLPAAPPYFPVAASGGLEFFALNQPAASPIPCVVSYDAGENVGVLGTGGTTLMTSPLAPLAGSYSSSVLGVPTALVRFGTSFNINTSGPDQPCWQEIGAQLGRVVLEVTACAAVPYGTGSPSGLGPAAPKMRAVALPFLGQAVVHTVEQHDDFAVQLMAGGFGRASFALPPFGTILIGSLDLLVTMNGGALVGPGTTAWSFVVPNLPSLVGATVNFQNLNLVLPSGTWSMSNGLEWVIGV
ncbi:MAG TPA: PKD domain-containing protein [Planctomycetota bacterium]